MNNDLLKYFQTLTVAGVQLAYAILDKNNSILGVLLNWEETDKFLTKNPEYSYSTINLFANSEEMHESLNMGDVLGALEQTIKDLPPKAKKQLAQMVKDL